MIYAALKGRLGNQMFIYAFAYALSRENNNELIILRCSEPIRLYNYNLKNIGDTSNKFCRTFATKIRQFLYAKAELKFSRKNLFAFEKKIRPFYEKNGLFYCQNGYLPFKRKNCNLDDISINGYFQSERYFDKYKSEIKTIFAPITQPKNTAFFNNIKNCQNPVCVDFRLGDYINNPLHSVCTIEYYKKAIKMMNEKISNPTFFIFSTDIDIVKKAFADTDCNFVYEDGSSEDFEKLFMMSSCKYFIITNSTYDWWAQYLCNNEDKIVIAPSRWFNGKCPCDIYQDNWLLIDC